MLTWRGQGIGELRGVDGQVLRDRDAAQALVNRKLYVERDRLPEPEPEEFYLADLIGLAAHENGAVIGSVLAVHDYGAGSSLEIGEGSRSLVLPFTRACVPEVDMAGGRSRDRASRKRSRSVRTKMTSARQRNELARYRPHLVPGNVSRPARPFACGACTRAWRLVAADAQPA